jgi:hypothetical protein
MDVFCRFRRGLVQALWRKKLSGRFALLGISSLTGIFALAVVGCDAGHLMVRRKSQELVSG